MVNPDSPDPGSGPSDLRSDTLLRACRTVEVEGVNCPLLGRYAILEKLGGGGAGAVYRGRHVHLGTDVAVKVLFPTSESLPQSNLERFFREARLAAQLRSPHLVNVLDVAEDEASGAHYLVMEHVAGRSAQEWIFDHVRARQLTSEREALALVRAATVGLAIAHGTGIVHRDVKPANILIPSDESGRPRTEAAKLGDLGLARQVEGAESLTRGQIAVGTPGFMAPEQVLDAGNVRQASDVFSTGATLYALLAGEPPFRGASHFEVLTATVEGRSAPLAEARPDVGRATRALVERCLAADPGARFDDAAALLLAIDNTIDVLEGRAPEPSEPPEPPPTTASFVQPWKTQPIVPEHEEPPVLTEEYVDPDSDPMLETGSIIDPSRSTLVQTGEVWSQPAQRPPSSVRSRPITMSLPPARRRRPRLAVGSVLFVALAGAAAWYFFGEGIGQRVTGAVDPAPSADAGPLVDLVRPSGASGGFAWVTAANGGFRAGDRRYDARPQNQVRLKRGEAVATGTSRVALSVLGGARVELSARCNVRLEGVEPDGTEFVVQSGTVTLLAGGVHASLVGRARLRVGGALVAPQGAVGRAQVTLVGRQAANRFRVRGLVRGARVAIGRDVVALDGGVSAVVTVPAPAAATATVEASPRNERDVTLALDGVAPATELVFAPGVHGGFRRLPDGGIEVTTVTAPGADGGVIARRSGADGEIVLTVPAGESRRLP
jgi:serine/threonine protein kinase